MIQQTQQDKEKLELCMQQTLHTLQAKSVASVKTFKQQLEEREAKIQLLEKRIMDSRKMQKMEAELLTSALYEVNFLYPLFVSQVLCMHLLGWSRNATTCNDATNERHGKNGKVLDFKTEN